MSIGGGIFLIVLGAILSFAVKGNLTDAVDLTLIGYIMMGAGALVTILGVAFTFRKRGTASTTRTVADPNSGEQITQRESTIK